MTTLQDAAFGATGGGPGGPGGSDGPGAPGAGRRRGGDGTGTDRSSWIGGAAGIVGLLALWWVLAITVLDNGGVVPTPWEVVRALWDDHRLMWISAKSTVEIAAKGWLIGNGLAIGLAVVFFGVPVVERVLLQIGVASYCLPIIAIGPILTTVFDGSTPQIALAGISVFFTTMVGTLLGLRAAGCGLRIRRASTSCGPAAAVPGSRCGTSGCGPPCRVPSPRRRPSSARSSASTSAPTGGSAWQWSTPSRPWRFRGRGRWRWSPPRSPGWAMR